MSEIIKPKNLGVKDYLIRKMSVKLNLNESILEKIINHQFQSANIAMKNNKSIELAGFGKFLFNNKKAIVRHNRNVNKKEALLLIINDETQSFRKRDFAKNKLIDVLKEIEVLKTRIDNENISN